MLLEEYPYKNRSEDIKRIEDEYLYGYELYRAGASSTYLVPLCIGAYGFINESDTEADAKNKAHEFVSKGCENYSTLKMLSIYAKTYQMDRNREVIKKSIKTVGPLFEGDVNVTDECLKNGTIFKRLL